MNAACLLTLAIVAELFATTFLKASEGFTRIIPSTLIVGGYGASFYLLSLVIKRMEVGIVYAIWSGAGTALMALIGWWLFKETLTPIKFVSFGFIVLGVVGLSLAETRLT